MAIIRRGGNRYRCDESSLVGKFPLALQRTWRWGRNSASEGGGGARTGSERRVARFGRCTKVNCFTSFYSCRYRC